MSILIAPSLLAADWLRLGEEVMDIQRGGADHLHLDVMDGHFVPNLTMGPQIVKAIARITTLPLDVHLIIDNPEEYIEIFADAGASILSFHIEVVQDVRGLIARIHDLGKQAGLTVSLETDIARIEPYLDIVDQMMVMSVNPGFGGQPFQAEALGHVRHIRRLAPPSLDIEIDGGINRETAPLAAEAGANILVAGTAVFGEPDRAEAIRALRHAAAAAVKPRRTPAPSLSTP
jgi:ribulose-phosphate 3-epimerase